MKKTRELKGMPVLTLQEGERLGQVRDLILDPAARQVVALILDRRVGGEDQVVATANVRNVGAAAITVEDRGSLVSLGRIPRFQELAQGRKPLQGKMVITEGGTRLGHVDDMEVDVQTFRLVSLVLKGFAGRGQSIAADRVRTIGADAIVVREEPAAVEASAAPLEVVEPVSPPTPTFEPKPFTPPEPVPAPPVLPAEVVPAIIAEPAPPSLSEDTLLQPLEPAGAEAEPAPAAPPAPAPAPAGEGENAWQRWVRRLKNG